MNIPRGTKRRTSMPVVARQLSTLLHNRKKLCKPTFTSRRVTESLPSLKIEVVIKIYSNYGNPDLIGCSSIGFYAAGNERLEVLKSKLEPFEDKAENLCLLTSGNLIKGKNDKMWQFSWPLPNNLPLKIKFTLEGKRALDFVRIWPPEDQSLAFKDIEMIVNGIVVYRGQLEATLGVDLPTKKVPPVTKQLFLESSSLTPKFDKYGIMPIQKTKKIRFIFLNCYDDDEFYTIQNISLYNENMEKISSEHFQLFSENFTIEKNPAMIFDETKNTENTNWYGKANNGIPSFQVEFILPTIISAISIGSVTIKNIIIQINGENVYHGRLPRPVEDPINDKIVEKTIHLVDQSETLTEKLDLNN